ncbi:ribonuclease HI [Catenibacterium sp.]|uniref:ribonuclease HI n=1 Tax=Catenibacterium sp. TaxID=2049022 RepID=UPI002E78EF9D|nr:RNase H family protein [Catenibacterium sp.]MEE0041512.1 RNase H family protein [Catenibacterium sp.]
MLQIYTDGAYKSSIDQGGIGIVWMKDDKVFKKYSKGFKHTTNNKMELIAMLCAFKSIKTSIDEVEFISDSQYVLGCLTKGWKKKKNVELWNILDKEYERVKSLVKNIKFTHVRGHQDCFGNNLADELASNASLELLE